MSVEFNENYLTALTQVDERSKSNSHRLDAVEEDIKAIKEENRAIHDIATSVKLIAQDMTYIKSDIAAVKETQADLTEQVSNLKDEPAKTKAAWVDKVIGAVCGAVGMAILSYVLSNLVNIFS